MPAPRTSTATAATRPHRSRRHVGLLLAGIVLALIAVGQVRPGGIAYAFDLDSHEAILRTALTTAMSKDALDEVTNYGIAVPEAGQKSEISSISLAPGASLHGLGFEQLWDNAATPAAICERWNSVTIVLKYALDQAAPKGAEYRELTDDKKARRAFGLAAVLMSNFYAHSNWVELAADRGAMPALAPLAGGCGAQSLPSDLQSGYYDAAAGADGCPKVGGVAKPPAPFKLCFSQLSKDTGDSGHGAQRATRLAGQPTYHDLAQQLAIDATQQLFTGLHNLVVQTYTPETWNANGQCVFDKLTRSSGDPDNPFGNTNVGFRSDASCLDISGAWAVSREADDGFPIENDDDLGKLLAAKQDRSTVTDRAHVYASFQSPDDGTCPLGGARSFFIDATLDGVKLQGTTTQCILSENIVNYCRYTGEWEPIFDGAVEGEGRSRTIRLQFVDEHWSLTTDDDGNIIACERNAANDSSFEVVLERPLAARP